MVNEINKSANDNAALSERLAASNRQLHEMQEEHRALLLEMETLRQRATELSRLSNMQQEQHQQQRRQQQQQAQDIDANKEAVALATATAPEPEPVPVSVPVAPTTATNLPTTEDQPKSTSETDKVEVEGGAQAEEDDASTAAYLQEKLAEIARLKSQFKRVQNMIDTTHLIEQHVAAKDAESVKSKSNENGASTTTTSTSTINVETPTQESAAPVAASLPVASAVVGTHAENEELLSTMLNMFTDFTGDLRSQAESLRAERDRIKLLRDEIVKRRQQ